MKLYAIRIKMTDSKYGVPAWKSYFHSNSSAPGYNRTLDIVDAKKFRTPEEAEKQINKLKADEYMNSLGTFEFNIVELELTIKRYL